MSLLVFNSSNRIAQGVIKRLYGSGNFEKIVCADLYPSYSSIQRFLKFKDELKDVSSNTKLSDIKANERSELNHAIQGCTHLLYVTHDYYSLTASKLNLIKTTAELAKKNRNLQRFVALTPVEHDHYGETNPAQAARTSEQEAINIYPNLVHLKTDLTFGPHSTAAHSILTRLVNGRGVPQASGASARPIHSDDVAAITETVLSEDKHQGKAYLLQGADSISLSDYINILKSHSGARDSESTVLEKIISPTGSTYFTQALYDPSYINLARLLKQYKSLEKEGFNTIDTPLKGIRSTYLEEKIKQSNYSEEAGFERVLKNFLY